MAPTVACSSRENKSHLGGFMPAATAKKKKRQAFSLPNASKISMAAGRGRSFRFRQALCACKKAAQSACLKEKNARRSEALPTPQPVVQSDVVDVMSKWPDNHFDTCITDPPYNIASDEKVYLGRFLSRDRRQVDDSPQMNMSSLPSTGSNRYAGSRRKTAIFLFSAVITISIQ